MTFISCFDKLQIYPCLFPCFSISRFEFKLKKIQIILTKYPKHVENTRVYFGVLQLKFKLYLQNTLIMFKMTRVYFGVLQVLPRLRKEKLHLGEADRLAEGVLYLGEPLTAVKCYFSCCTVFCAGWLFGRAPSTKGALSGYMK